MSKNYSILDYQLPINQNFKQLKDKGLSIIQNTVDNSWTNLNPSDPGVTILDQVCYALTELGYCNDFDIKDIFTDHNGKLIVENQFYLPEEILTTSPITINDYRKYIIDRVHEVDNVTINVLPSSKALATNIYQSYLYIERDQYVNKDAICDAAFFELNASRNLNEIFIKPIVYSEKIFELVGDIHINSISNLSETLLEISTAIRDFIFPKVKQSGYDELKKNAIFDGPILENGWIRSKDLGKKKSKIENYEVNQLIGAIKNIVETPNLKCVDEIYHAPLSACTLNEIFVLDLISSISPKIVEGKNVTSKLNIYCDGHIIKQPQINTAINHLKSVISSKEKIASVSTVNLSPKLPKGSYRHIDSYYSIQNTFPELFKVGKDQIDKNAEDYEIAHVRQLKGYLTLFDQVIANQFSQLANVSKLFSFKNALTAAPHSQKVFYEKRDSYQKEHIKYPSPYEVFSPTYFYQSLKKVPNIKSLLENNNAHEFQYKLDSKDQLEKKSWKAYKDDPYNTYMFGLQTIMTDGVTDFSRRNDILDHLLSRFGESPLLFDSFLKDSKFSGSTIKDKVIFKSLFLQNLGVLSYNRSKSYNYASSSKLCTKLFDDKEVFEEVLLLEENKNFDFDSNTIDYLERIKSQYFINYSTIELKLSLYLGFGIIYNDFIRKCNIDLSSDNQIITQVEQQVKVALWLIQQKKGALFIETNLLLQAAEYQVVIHDGGDDSCWSTTYFATNSTLSFSNAIDIGNWLNEYKEVTSQYDFIDYDSSNGLILKTNLETFDISYSDTFNWDGPWFDLPNAKGLKMVIIAKWDDNTRTYMSHPAFNDSVQAFIPSFIPTLNTPIFNKKRNQLFESELPMHVNVNTIPYDENQFLSLIPKYVKWHNAVRFNDSNFQKLSSEVAKESAELAQALLKLKS